MILKVIKSKPGVLEFEENEIIDKVNRTKMFYDNYKQLFLEIRFENEKPVECMRLTRIPYEEENLDKDDRPSEGYMIYLMNDKGQTIERII